MAPNDFIFSIFQNETFCLLLFRWWKSAGTALRRPSRFWLTLTSTCWGCGARWARSSPTCRTLRKLQNTPAKWWTDTRECKHTTFIKCLVTPKIIFFLFVHALHLRAFMKIDKHQAFSVKILIENKSESCISGRKLYHPHNAALGMAAMRTGVTHWQAGLIEVGHGMICKAYAILMVTHGPTHPITKDLEVNNPIITQWCVYKIQNLFWMTRIVRFVYFVLPLSGEVPFRLTGFYTVWSNLIFI